MDTLHEAASHHLPPFITAPGHTDWLLVVMGVILVGAVLAAGVFFFWLHSLPERMVHHKAQFDLVCVLALLSLFTHIHAFWVAALILAFIEFPSFSLPEFSSSLGRIAGSLEAMADAQAQTRRAKLLPMSSPSGPAKSADGTTVTHGHEPARKREAEDA